MLRAVTARSKFVIFKGKKPCGFRACANTLLLCLLGGQLPSSFSAPSKKDKTRSRGTTRKPNKTRVIMATAAEIRNKEKARVQTGAMKGLGRLVIFTPNKTTDDGMRWCQVDIKDLVRVPPGVDSNTRLSKKARQAKVVLESKDPDTDSYVAQIFARVEEGRILHGNRSKQLKTNVFLPRSCQG